MVTADGTFFPAMEVEENVETGTRHTRRSATFIGIFTFAARIVERLGAFGQIALIASVYGSSYIADRYFIASIAPLIIGAIAGEAFSANILPALVRSAGEKALVAAGFWITTGLMVFVSACYLAIAAIVVNAYSPAGSHDLRVWFAFAPVGALLGISGYLAGVLTYYERYVWPPFRSALSTAAGFIATAVVLLFTHDLFWVAAAVTFGYALSWLMLVLETRRIVGPGAFARVSSSGFDAAFALRGGLSAPVLGGLLGGQVFVLLERLLASTVGVGAVSTLSYARGVVFTPSIISQSIALGLYPGMVRAHEANDVAHIRGSLLRGLRATLFVAVVFAGFFVLFAQPTTNLLLRRGAFDPSAAHHVASALAAFSLALVGTMLMVFVARIFYAIAYFRGVVWTQVVALAVYVVLAFPLRSLWATSGLAIAFGIAEVTGGVFGLALAGRKAALAGRVALVEACVPACARAAVVVAALAVVRLAAGDGLPAFVIAVAGALVVGAAVLWQASWPELGGVKRGVRRVLAR